MSSCWCFNHPMVKVKAHRRGSKSDDHKEFQPPYGES